MLKFIFGIIVGVYMALIHLLLGVFVLYSMTTTEAGKELLDEIMKPNKEKK